MAVTQVSDLNSLFNEIIENARFVARQMNLMTNLVDVRNATGWMDRKIPTRPTISAVSVNETEDFNSPTTFGTSNLATITPGEVIAQVVLTDRDMETDPSGAQMQAEQELGGAVGTKVDTDLLSTFTSFTTDKGDGAGNSFTFSNWAAGVSVVEYNKARQFGAISSVLHPYHWHDIWVELGEPTATTRDLGDITVEALRSYFVDRLLNVDVYLGYNITTDASDDAISATFGARAIMFDVRRAMRMETQRDASARATELNVTMGYGYGIVHNAEGVKYTADATEPT